jgi:hypothetical protein
MVWFFRVERKANKGSLHRFGRDDVLPFVVIEITKSKLQKSR